MKRIAIVITVLSYGGAQTMLSELVNHIDKREFRVKVFVLKSPQGTRIEQEIKSAGIDCQFLNMESEESTFKKIKDMFRLARAIDAFNPELVHSHLDTFYSPLYCFLKKVPFVFTVHSFPNRILHFKFRFLLERLRKRHLLRIVGCAECVTEDMINEMGKAYKNICTTIYNPIDVVKYSANTEQRRNNTFVHVGRMETIKNQILIIKGFERLHRLYGDIKLIMVGDGPLMKSYVEYVNQHSLESSVIFLGNRADVASILSTCDFFVLSSNSECCPISILEALASGLPIISTDVGGVKEIVQDAGLLYKVDDVHELYDAMRIIYENTEMRENMIIRSQEIIKRFDVKQIVPQYESIYQMCLRK